MKKNDHVIRNFLIAIGGVFVLCGVLSIFIGGSAPAPKTVAKAAAVTSPLVTITSPSPSEVPSPTAAPTAAPEPVVAPVADPLAPLRAQGISAICKDGTYSHSTKRSGTCAGHGGVRTWTGLI